MKCIECDVEMVDTGTVDEAENQKLVECPVCKNAEWEDLD